VCVTVYCACQNVVAYMESVGFPRSDYSLLLPYPRRCVSSRLDASLTDLGLVTDSALIVDLHD